MSDHQSALILTWCSFLKDINGFSYLCVNQWYCFVRIMIPLHYLAVSEMELLQKLHATLDDDHNGEISRGETQDVWYYDYYLSNYIISRKTVPTTTALLLVLWPPCNVYVTTISTQVLLLYHHYYCYELFLWPLHTLHPFIRRDTCLLQFLKEELDEKDPNELKLDLDKFHKVIDAQSTLFLFQSLMWSDCIYSVYWPETNGAFL